jgi:hypothetical protein
MTIKLWMMPACLGPSSVQQKSQDLQLSICLHNCKAFLFVGSERARHVAAIYYSRVESCKANKVNPLSYLTYVLDNAHNRYITLPRPEEFADSNIAHVG